MTTSALSRTSHPRPASSRRVSSGLWRCSRLRCDECNVPTHSLGSGENMSALMRHPQNFFRNHDHARTHGVVYTVAHAHTRIYATHTHTRTHTHSLSLALALSFSLSLSLFLLTLIVSASSKHTPSRSTSIPTCTARWMQARHRHSITHVSPRGRQCWSCGEVCECTAIPTQHDAHHQAQDRVGCRR